MTKRYEELTIADDFMFGKAMGDKVLCHDVLERLLEEKVGELEDVQERQGLYISCIEEIAFKRGFIDRDQLLALAQPLLKTNYGKYLTEVVNGL